MFSRFSFKAKLFIGPVVTAIILLVIAFDQRNYSKFQHDRMENVTIQNLNSLKKIIQFEEEISDVYGKVHSLIISVNANMDINGELVDEEYIYIHGKPLIYKLHKQKNILETDILPLLDNNEELREKFKHYIHYSSTAITMVSVDLKLAGIQAAQASTYFNAIVKIFSTTKQDFLVLSQNQIDEVLAAGMNREKESNIFILTSIIFIIFFSLWLYRKLSIDFELISNAINRLSNYDLEFQIPTFKDNKEFHKISLGLNVFKEKIIAEQKFQAELMLSAKVFENALESIVITDADNKIIRTNNAYTNITGYLQEDAIGKNPSINSSGMHNEEFYKNMWIALNKDQFWQGEVINKKKDGSLWPCWMSINSMQHNNSTYHIAVALDISAMKSSQEKIEFLAYHDTLTSLPNRSLLMDRMKHALDRAKRNSSIFAILFFDIDKFKYINDNLGHSVGDELLIEIAERLTKVIRPEDTIARFGGDEFLILIEDIEFLSEINIIIARVKDIFNTSFILASKELNISASIGVSVYPTDSSSVDELIKNADMAMYEAKKQLGTSVEFYSSSMSEDAREYFELENELSVALENRELMVYYQPQINVESMKLSGAEALIRWNHPEKGWISPEKFIGVAEKSLLIHDIGLYVFEEVCLQMSRWKENGIDNIRVAVNLSMKQFDNEALAQDLYSIVKKYNLKTSMIELEVTESNMMESKDNVLKQLSSLNSLGFYLAIDDFGTGYSSLSLLKELPFHRLKIDRSFVMDINTDEDDRILVLTILAMGKNLNLNIIAEGVEDKEQFEFLKNNGCDDIQGFYFSKAVSIEEFENQVLKNF